MPATQLDYEPEQECLMRARYDDALAHLYDASALQKGAIAPHECRSSVFDFEDGLRLVVYRVRVPDGSTCVDVSCAVALGSPLFKSLEMQTKQKGCLAVLEHLKKAVPSRFKAISGVKGLTWLGEDAGGQPHWIMPLTRS